MTEADLSNPILNSPFDLPERHFELGERGPTGEIKEGRRRSESFIPVPRSTKDSGEQQALDFDATGERLEQNSLINDIRREVERWRASNWNGVTPYTRKLLAYWAAGPHPDDPVFFCQREAAETAIFLVEVAGRHGTADYRRRLEPVNAEHNSGLPGDQHRHHHRLAGARRHLQTYANMAKALAPSTKPERTPVPTIARATAGRAIALTLTADVHRSGTAQAPRFAKERFSA